jgi:hypothetical protein
LHICIQKWFHRFGCQSDGGEFVSFSHMKTTERKTEDQSLIFGNRMKTKKWWIIIRLHFLRGTDLRDSPKMRGCSNRILDNIQTEKVRVLFCNYLNVVFKRFLLTGLLLGFSSLRLPHHLYFRRPALEPRPTDWDRSVPEVLQPSSAD